MKIVVSVLLVVAVAGCIILGIFFIGAQNDLNLAEDTLQTAQTQLTENQNELAASKTELAEAQSELTRVEGEWHKTNQDLTSTQVELAHTKNDLTDMTRHYNRVLNEKNDFLTDYLTIRDVIYQKLGDGSDSNLYITPDDPSVAVQAEQIAGSFASDTNEMWNDYRRMHNWIINNILYYADTGLPILPETPDGDLQWMSEYWKMPSETLTDGSGDCEDMANLLASMMLSYNHEDFAVWVLIVHNEDSGHAAVALPVTGDKLVIFDPAGDYYSGWTTGSVLSLTTSTAVNTWLSYWEPQMPGAQITAAYSYDFHREFDSTQEFIQWANDQYDD